MSSVYLALLNFFLVFGACPVFGKFRTSCSLLFCVCSVECNNSVLHFFSSVPVQYILFFFTFDKLSILSSFSPFVLCWGVLNLSCVWQVDDIDDNNL